MIQYVTSLGNRNSFLITYVGILCVLYGLFNINYFIFMMGQWASFVLRKRSIRKLHPENLIAMVLIECPITLAVCIINFLMSVFPFCLLFFYDTTVNVCSLSSKMQSAIYMLK